MTDEYLLRFDDDLRRMPGKLAAADNFVENCTLGARNWIGSEFDLRTRREQIDVLEEKGIFVRYTPDNNMCEFDGERFGIAGCNHVFEDENGIMRLKGSKHSNVAKITSEAAAKRDCWKERAEKEFLGDAARIAKAHANWDNQFIIDTYIAGTPIDYCWSGEVQTECLARNKANGVQMYVDLENGGYKVKAQKQGRLPNLLG